MVDHELQCAAERYVNWVRSEALPLWERVGVAESGGHVERLQYDGIVDRQTPIRVRVQARQIYTFAKAFHTGWSDRGLALAEQILAFCDNTARHPRYEEGYIHQLNNAFQPHDLRIDLYDHAFFLLAYAALFEATGEINYLNRAERLWCWLHDFLGDPSGGWREGDYNAPYRRQNPHMHLFEAFLSLYETSSNKVWLQRAEDVLALFKRSFFDSDHRVVREFFTDDWKPVAGELGRLIEPGHLLEWVWLLRKCQNLTGNEMSTWVTPLYERAHEIGFSASGLIWDTTDILGKPLSRTKRTWPLTEAIKANISQIKFGIPDAKQRAAFSIDTLITYYLSVPVSGSWIDLRGEQDDVANDFAPASTFYHLICAALEVNAFVINQSQFTSPNQ